MLASIRKRTASWVVKGLLLLLVLSFAAWGIGDIFRGGRESTVAEVGGIRITGTQFMREFQREIDRVQYVFEGTLTTERAREMGLVDNALDRLISGLVFELEAQALRLATSDALVAVQIRANPSFRDGFGEFSEEVFYRLLADNRLTEEEFVKLVRSGILRNQLTEAVTHGTVLPERLGVALFKFLKEKRVAEVVEIPASKMKEIGSPDANALTDYYEAHIGTYMAPEYRAITGIILTPAHFMGEADIPEKELREEYENEARIGELGIPEHREIEQILLSDQESATQAEAMLAAGKTFEEVAREVGKVKEGVSLSLGNHPRQNLIPEIADTAFQLPEGAISKPIRSPFGWHILRVKKIEPSSTPSFEDVRAQIAEGIAQDRAINSLYAVSTQLEDLLAGGASLDAAGKTLNLPISHFDKVTAKGKDAAGKPIASFPDIQDFLAVAFKTAEGENSALTETKEGGFFLLRVDSITPSTARPLEEIRARVIADWQAKERMGKAKETAALLVAEAGNKESLKTLARNRGLAFAVSRPLARDEEDDGSGVTAELVREIFAAKPGAVVMAPSKNGYAVAEVKKILEADIEKDTKALEEVRQEALEAMAGDVLDQYAAALRKKYGVKVNRSAIEAAF